MQAHPITDHLLQSAFPGEISATIAAVTLASSATSSFLKTLCFTPRITVQATNAGYSILVDLLPSKPVTPFASGASWLSSRRGVVT